MTLVTPVILRRSDPNRVWDASVSSREHSLYTRKFAQAQTLSSRSLHTELAIESLSQGYAQ